ncbi:hypothetical protein RLEG12_00805 (plasmid) [Rhizobium leguminosarum bv. trifolii CB782]|nr:hypothetical protein RLEG12_00805 [Rhizobium leguminosarum bv. trifolii CB782]
MVADLDDGTSEIGLAIHWVIGVHPELRHRSNPTYIQFAGY